MSNSIDEEWSRLSLLVANDPDNFKNWESLVALVFKGLSKVSSQERLDLMRITTDQFLLKYPLLEQYWVNYAQLEFVLGFTDKARLIFEKSLTVLPYSNLIWLNYLSLVELVEINYERVLTYYQKAETKVGFHYHSYEFWQSYLRFEEKNNGKSLFYYNLLKKILEIPIFNYSYFFKLFFKEIEELDKEALYKLIGEVDLQKKLKADLSKDSNLHDLKAKLKKIYTDVYITTQFRTFELYNYEKNVKLEYFVPGMIRSYQEIANWEQYLSYTEINGSIGQIHQLYERCLVPMARYPQFWLKYANHLIKRSQLQDAKNVLYKALSVLSDSNNLVIHLKLIKLEISLKNFLRAKSLTLSLLDIEDNVEVFLYLVNIEHLINSSDVPKFKALLLDLVKEKPLELASPLLRHISNFQRADLNPEDLQYVNDDSKFNRDVNFWVLYLNKLIEGDSKRSEILTIYKDALKKVDSPRRLVQWYEDHLNYEFNDEELLTQFAHSSQLLFNV